MWWATCFSPGKRRKSDFPIAAESFRGDWKNDLTSLMIHIIIALAAADLAHLVERHLAKVEVASSSLVIRSTPE